LNPSALSILRSTLTTLLGAAETEALIKRFGAEMSLPTRRLHEKDLSGPCYVYRLLYPLDQKPFYVGISKNPWSRFDNHMHDPCSAAYPILRQISVGANRDQILEIYKECVDRNTALDLEFHLITTTPGLVNRCRKRSQMFEYEK